MLPIIATCASILSVVSSAYAFLQKVRNDLLHHRSETRLEVQKAVAAVDVAHIRIDENKDKIESVDKSIQDKVALLDDVISDAKQQLAVVDSKLSDAPNQ